MTKLTPTSNEPSGANRAVRVCSRPIPPKSLTEYMSRSSREVWARETSGATKSSRALRQAGQRARLRGAAPLRNIPLCNVLAVVCGIGVTLCCPARGHHLEITAIEAADNASWLNIVAISRTNSIFSGEVSFGTTMVLPGGTCTDENAQREIFTGSATPLG